MHAGKAQDCEWALGLPAVAHVIDSLRVNHERRLVPEEGVEPSRPEGHGILSPARLPVSPLRPGGITVVYASLGPPT